MAKEITLTIDGQTVPVPEGTTVLKAAEMVEIDIPRLCYFEGLPPSGTCRLCLVEIEGQQRLAVSCTQRVKEGMVVHTQSERVTEARRFVLELIWSTHPGDCTTCEKSGACDLQRYTYEYDVDKSRYPLYVPEGSPVEHHDPLIERNLNLCILCGRCIRVCREQGQGILDFMERGMTTVVTTPLDRPLLESGCDFCGSCIAVCPVGCLVERNRKLRGREWEFESKETRCGLCNLGCDLIVDVARGRVVRTRPGKDGYLCSRGKFGWDFLTSEERLSHPMIRDGNGFKECNWDEALNTIAKRLSEVRNARGADAIGGLIGGHVSNEALYSFGELLRAGIGTNNVDSTARFVGANVATQVLDVFGSLDALASTKDLEHAKTILTVGSELGESYPRARLAIKRTVEKGAKLVVIDSSDSELTQLSTLHLKPKRGAEAAVLDGVIRALLDAGLHDTEFLSSCEGFSEGVESAGSYDAGLTGISDEQIQEASKLFAKGRAVIALSDLREETIARALPLLILTGRPKRGLLALLPMANPWGVTLLARSDADLSAQQMLNKDSPIAALYVVGADPINDGREKLRNLEFLIVQDLFLTETAKLADVVLPLNGFLEEEGSVFNAGGKLVAVSSAAPARHPPLWEVSAQLSERLGHAVNDSAREIRAKIKAFIQDKKRESLLRFPRLTDERGKHREPPSPFPRFTLPETSWGEHSQISEPASDQEVGVGSSSVAPKEVEE
jgi:formate dehydrogenase alpha subunit